MEGLKRAIDAPTGLLAWLGGLSLVLMMLHVVADVIGKYVFNAPVPGTIEVVAAYYMVMALFLPLAYVTRGEHHITIEMFTSRMKPHALARLKVAVGLLTFLYMAVFTWKAGEEAVERTIDGEVWQSAGFNVVVWPSRWTLVLGCGLMAACVALHVLRDLKHTRPG
jgi:TRAP-type C4-dicarboxylate transport system permease small subunit